MNKVSTLEEAVKLVPDGARIGFGGSNALWRRPMAFVRELVRAERTGLHLFNMIGGPEIDLLLGAGAVASTNSSYVGFDEIGHAPHFQAAARAGTPAIIEYSEFSFMASLRAAVMGLPFMPWKTAWGTDVVRNLGWKTIVCPYTGMELLAVPANPLDVTIIHASRCDSSGNVELPRPLDFIYDFDYTIARAAKQVIVCTERIEPIEDPTRVALIGREVTCVVHTPRGAWPCGIASEYPVDIVHLAEEYLPAAATPEGFAAYLDRFVRSGEGVVV